MKQPLNEQFRKMQKLAGINENQINEYDEAIPFDKWESVLTDFIQKNLTSDIDEVENLNDVLRNIIATNEQELASMSEEVKKVVNENITKKAKDFIKSNHNPGEEEDHITYEYSSSEIDPEILKYIKDNKRLNVTVNGQSAAMTLKGNKVVVEFF